MSKGKSTGLFEINALSVILIYLVGIKNAGLFFYQVLKEINLVSIQVIGSSFFSIIFKYCITFPIVGLILSYIGSPRGTVGHFIGKTLYFVIGYFVCVILDFLASIIF